MGVPGADGADAPGAYEAVLPLLGEGVCINWMYARPLNRTAPMKSVNRSPKAIKATANIALLYSWPLTEGVHHFSSQVLVS